MITAFLLLLMAAAGTPAHIPSRPSLPTVPMSPQVIELVDLTTDLLGTEKTLINGFRASLNKSLKQDKNIAALEVKKPGLRKALAVAVNIAIDRQASIEVRYMRNFLAAYYLKILAADEIDAATTFFRSPTGQRMASIAAQEMKAEIARRRNSGELQSSVDPADVGKTMNTVETALTQGLSAEDLATAAAFSETSAARKIETARPQIAAQTAQLANAMGQNMANAMLAAAENTIKRHLSQ